jgi:hypothetical protein
LLVIGGWVGVTIGIRLFFFNNMLGWVYFYISYGLMGNFIFKKLFFNLVNWNAWKVLMNFYFIESLLINLISIIMIYQLLKYLSLFSFWYI